MNKEMIIKSRKRTSAYMDVRQVALRSIFSITALVFSNFVCAENIQNFALNTVNNGSPYIGQIQNTNAIGYLLGDQQGCSFISITYNSRIDHYRVCGNEVIPRDGVAPLFPSDDHSAARQLKITIDNAILRGHSKSTWNDYVITAERLNDSNKNCSLIEVFISYDLYLVDSVRKQVCIK